MTSGKKQIVVLGSTGSIGRNALEVIRKHPDEFEVAGLSAGTNWELLLEQINEFSPRAISVKNADILHTLRDRLKTDRGEDVEIPGGLHHGEEGLKQLASLETADIVLSSVSGAAGLPGSLAAVRSGKRLALANKESMVIAGPILSQIARENGAEIIPVDSEHSSLFQLLNGLEREEVEQIILTASGGPFRKADKEQIENATPEEALDHPTWDMGDKITIDSATLMNKAFEIIEARYLFDIDAEHIEVYVHPQSTVHGLVKVSDGSLFAHLGIADMKGPIHYSFTYPERAEGVTKSFDITGGKELTFEEPRTELFPALEFGFRVAREGGTSGAALNAANEVAVDAFLNEDISFPDISRLVGQMLDRHEHRQNPNLEDIRRVDRAVRERAESWVHRADTKQINTTVSKKES